MLLGSSRLTGHTPISSVSHVGTVYVYGNDDPVDYASTGADIGDLAVFFDVTCNGGNSTTGLPPTAVTPSGWTSFINHEQSPTATYYNTRLMVSYKVLTTSDFATGTITGMTNAGVPYKMVSVYRGNGRIQAVVPSTPVVEISTGDPASQSLPMASGNAPLIGFGYYGALAGIATRTASGATFTEVAGGGTGGRQYLKYCIFNSGSTPTNATIDMPASRDVTSPGIQPDVLASFYLKIY